MSVRHVTAQIITGGGVFPLLSGQCDFNFQQHSSTFSASLAISGTNMPYWASAGPLEVSLVVMGAELFAGIVDNVNPDYASGVLKISGRDQSAKLHERTTKDSFVNKKRTAIVRELAARAGLSVIAQEPEEDSGEFAGKHWDTPTAASITSAETLWSVIQRFAKIDNMQAFVQGRSLHYVNPSDPGAAYSFAYVPPIPLGHAAASAVKMSFTRNVNLGKTLKVKVKGWHPKKKKLVEGEVVKAGYEPALEFVDYKANHLRDNGAAKARASKKLKEIAKKEYSCTVHAPGDPTANKRGTMSIFGTGTAFDGAYPLDSIHHSFATTAPYEMTLHGSRGR